MKPENQAEWLKGIDEDQNLVGLENISTPKRNQGGRRWFLSKLLALRVKLGQYDARSGKIVLSEFPIPAASYDATTTADALTLTCEAGYDYEVYLAAASDTDNAFVLTLTGTIGGVACGGLPSMTAGVAAGDWGFVIGGVNNLGAATDTSLLNSVWLAPGDSLTITIVGFASPDANHKVFLYRKHKRA